MPRPNIDLSLSAAMLVDTPLSYSPPRGPEMRFTLNYHQATAMTPPKSNFGPN